MPALKRIVEPEEPPVSLDEIKLHLAIEFDDHDAMLEDMLREATGQLDGKDGDLQRCIMPQTWEWALDDWPEPVDGGDGFKVPLPPLLSVESIKYQDEDGVQQTLANDGTAFVVDTYREPGWIVPITGVPWPRVQDRINAIIITFRAGYEGPITGTTTAVPPTIKRIIKAMVAHMYEHRGDEGGVDLPALTREQMDLFRVYTPSA